MSISSRRLLVFSYFFPPSNEVASKPTARLLRHLARADWEIVVVVPPTEAYEALDRDGYADVEHLARLERTGMWAHPLDVYLSLKRAFRGLRGKPTAQGQSTKQVSHAGWGPPANGTTSLRGMALEMLAFPDRYVGWIIPAAAAALRLHRKKPFDAMLSVYPAASAQLAALRFHGRAKDVAWLAQFHDPWSCSPFRTWTAPFLARLETKLESKVLHACDAVLCATEEATRRMQADYAAPKRFATIHNAFDPEDFPAVSAAPRSHARLVLTHTGTLYGPRNPVPFLRVIANLIRAGRLSPDRILIRLVGNCEGPLGRTVPGLVAELGLQQVVELLPPVSYPEALRYLYESDVLLLFAEGQPLQVPAKLYEYLHVGRTILGFCEGASARIICDTKAGEVVTSNDSERMERLVLRWASLFSQGGIPDTACLERIAYYRADAVAHRFAGEVEQAIAAASSRGSKTAARQG
jgi:glycosyltransferase involved in cell wall biosynthesis